MRQFIIPILSALCLAACNSDKSTDALLIEVWNSDQGARTRMAELTKAVTVEGRTELIDSLIAEVEAVERTDLENIAIIDSLLKDGLPANLTPQSYKTIWIVIDHASLEKQEQYLPLIEEMSQRGLIGNDEYAILYDRIAMKRNRPQRYGSQTIQFGSPGAMNFYVFPVENPTILDSLRASVGMSSMEEYLKQLTHTTGIKAEYIPAITVEQLNTMQIENCVQ